MEPREIPSGDFWKAKQVSTWLGLSERQIWRMLDAGLIPPPLKFGGASRWSAATLQAWIDGGAKPVRPSAPAGRAAR